MSNSAHINHTAKGISIITPFYNQDEIFWETYAAVLKQTFNRWQWIIVNDGSTATQSLISFEKLAAKGDERIFILHCAENAGLPAARNKGVRQASYDYVFFLDSDDLIEPDYLEKAWVTLQLNEAFSFVNSWSTGFDEKNYLWPVGLERGKRFLKENAVAFCGLFRKAIFNQLQFNEERRGGLEDWEFWLQAASKGFWGYTIPEYLFHYRIRQQQKAKWKNWDEGKNQKKVARELQKQYGHLKKLFPAPLFSTTPYNSLLQLGITEISGHDKIKPLLLIVLPWLQLGGVEQFTLEWMRHLKPNYDFLVVTTNSSEPFLHGEFKKLSCAIFHLPHLCAPQLFPALINYLIQHYAPQMVVLSHTQTGYHLLPFIRSVAPYVVIVDINHVLDPYAADSGFPGVSIRHTHYIDAHVVVSHQLKQWMIAAGADERKIHVFYIGADVTLAQRPVIDTAGIATSFQTAEDTVLILFSGRLTDQKNVLVLPQIAEALKKRTTNFKLLISGDGPDKAQLEETIYKKRVGAHVILLGALPHPENIALLKNADIFILPSKWEGIATVLYEAMLLAKPVIATDVGGQRELITEETGFLLPLQPEATIAERFVETILLLMQNKSLRLEVGNKASARIRRCFDKQQIFSEMQIAFDRLLHQPVIEKPALTESEAVSQYRAAVQQMPAHQFTPVHLRPQPSAGYERLKKIYKMLTGKRPIPALWKRN